MRCQAGSVVVSNEADEKVLERNTFVFLAVVLAPVLAVAIVGGYGFTVWISQLILGPPGYGS
jgi:nitrate reductase NapE